MVRPTLLSVLSLSLLACNAELSGDSNRGELLHSLAKASALSLSDPAVRAELRSVWKRPDAREGQLRLSEISRGASLTGSVSLPRFASALQQHSVDATGMLHAFPEDVDIYMPIDAQREGFSEEVEPLVVVVEEERMLDDEAPGFLTAYDLNGNSQGLDASVVPNRPVIVVTPCEHESHSPDGLVGMQENNLSEESLPAQTESAASACSGREHQDGDAHIMRDFMIRNAYEPWFFGDPEIELYMAFPQGLQARFALDGGEIDVNVPNQRYNVELPLYRWDRNLFAQDILYRVIEKDGGFKMDVKVKATVPLPYGVGAADVDFTTTIQNMDDDLGIQFVRFDDPCGALYSTGAADWTLYYSPQ